MKYPVINYQTSDGLPQNLVNALIQDKMGYIVIGTQSGIGKWDGTKFEVITKKDGLSYSFINDFAIDKDNNLWVATQEGLSRINLNGVINNFLGSLYIHTVNYEEATDTLWIAAIDGLYMFTQDKIIPFEAPSDTSNSVNIVDINGVAISANARYFYSSSRIIKNVDKDFAEISSEFVINFVKYLPTINEVVVGTEKGIFKISKNKPRLIPLIQLPNGMTNVSDVDAGQNKSVWIGTQQGLLFYRNLTETPIIITNENGLSSHNIRKLLVDREGNLLMGSQWGISLLSAELIKMYDQSDGLPHQYTWSFYEDGAKILVSCDQGIVELDTVTEKITPFTSVNASLSNYSIRSIIKFDENHYMLGTRRNGIFRWDRKNNLNHVHIRANVFAAAKDQNNMIWYGTNNGLLKYDGKNFNRYFYGLRDKNIFTLAVYDKNSLLVGTGKGVQMFTNGQFIESRFDRCIPTDIVINDIKVISLDEILIATELNGFYICKKNSVKHITMADGLMNNDVWSIIKDNNDNIWLNTSVSLERFSNGSFSHFSKKTGLFGDEGSLHSAFKAGNGDIYFSIIPGFIRINGRSSSSEIVDPILYIKDVKVNEKSVKISPNGAETPTIELSHNRNSIQFDYIAVTTRKENPVYYSTRLLPLDENWSAPNHETHVKYLKLPPNDYIFEVKANNGGGENKWFTSLNKISFSIAKPFWLTWWFIICCIISIILIILQMVKWRLKSLEKQKKHLEELVEERTKELEYLSITDPLTDLKNRRYLEEKIKEDISLIERYLFDSQNPDELDFRGFPILGVFILDIDYFKKVNDEYGHKAGDIVIIDIARLLIEMLRNSDTIVRWGGEEFLIITWQKEKSRSFELAERIRKRIESFPFKVDDHITINKTVSVGFAHFPFLSGDIDRVNWSHVVSLADSALYLAKNNGRNMSVGIESGNKNIPNTFDVKTIVSDIKLGLDQKYLKLITDRDNLHVTQHKA